MSAGEPERMEEGDEEEWTVFTGAERGIWDYQLECARRLRVAANITSIEDSFFFHYYCHDLLTEVDLCDVTEIGNKAFMFCKSLTRVNLPKVTVIGERSFQFCKSLKSISIPPSVAEIGCGAFGSCDGLVSVKLCDGLERIGEYAFKECSLLERIVIPSTVIRLDGGAFSGCKSLISVDLPEGLKAIERYTFHGCESLERVVIPSTVFDLGIESFKGCSSLVSIDLPEGLESISRYAFLFCRSLELIKIPSTLVELGEEAFGGCSNLSNVELTGGGILALGTDVFNECPSLERVTLPSPSFVISNAEADGGIECRLLQEGASISPESLLQVASRCMEYMTSNQLTEAGGKINEIIDQDDQTVERRLKRIRELFAYYELFEATSLLELAIWKARIGNNVGRDGEVRQALRRACGRDMQIVIGGVLRYLDRND